jgi:hypothetical protein
MDAAQALLELGELSSQVERAVVLDDSGTVEATLPAGEPADALAQAALDVVAVAGELHASAGEVTAVEVELEEGGLFVLRETGRTIAATTGPDPTAGLVTYDLRTCLRRMADEPAPKRRRARKHEEESA